MFLIIFLQFFRSSFKTRIIKVVRCKKLNLTEARSFENKIFVFGQEKRKKINKKLAKKKNYSFHIFMSPRKISCHFQIAVRILVSREFILEYTGVGLGQMNMVDAS